MGNYEKCANLICSQRVLLLLDFASRHQRENETEQGETNSELREGSLWKFLASLNFLLLVKGSTWIFSY